MKLQQPSVNVNPNGDDFETVKRTVSLRDEIERRTRLTFKKVGSSWDLSECPFCGHKGCFRVGEKEGIEQYHCHSGGCGAEGSVIDFVMQHAACSAKEALEDLAEFHNIPITTYQPAECHIPQHADIFEAAANHYHRNLLNDKAALEYQLNTRGHSLETLKRFQVGFTDGGLIKAMQGQGFTIEQIIDSGLAKQKEDGTTRDFFISGLFIYPHRNISGKVGDFTIKDQRKKFDYRLKKEHRDPDTLFHNMPAFKHRTVILVEGQNDVLSVAGKGGFGAVAGTCGQLSGEQMEYIKKWAGQGREKTLFMCFDNDEGGEGYSTKLQTT